jgi:hypothetical protein
MTTQANRGSLGRAYLGARRYGDAIDLLEPLVEEFTRLLGPEHRYTLAGRCNLGYAYNAAGRFDDAMAELSPSLGPAPQGQLLAIVVLAQDRLRRGLARSVNPETLGDDVLELLRAVARDGDAEAFARLPEEVRATLLEEPASSPEIGPTIPWANQLS